MILAHGQTQSTILVVDDTAANLDVLKAMLENDYRIRFARNGPLAIKIANTKQPDLILLDVSMPEMDGYEVCEILKTNEVTRDIPVIFVTAKVDVMDETKGLLLGAVDYITKPLNPAIVHVRVRNQLAIKQAHDSLKQQVAGLASINRLAEKISISLDLAEIQQMVCQELVTIFDAGQACWWSWDTDKTELQLAACVEENEPSDGAPKIVADGPVLDVLELFSQSRDPFVIAQDAPQVSAALNIPPFSEALVIPIVLHNDVAGALLMPVLSDGQIFANREMVMAKTIALQISGTIENADLYARMEQALGVVQRDLDIGQEIQSGFFPEELPKISGWELASYFAPARQVAGDFFDAFVVGKNGSVGLVIADVCDKGVGAALYMVTLRSLIRSLSEGEAFDQDPEGALLNMVTAVNRYLSVTHGKSNMFATMFVSVLTAQTDRLVYVNAGHESPILLNADGHEKQELAPTGPAVGLSPDLTFEVDHVSFAQGDLLIAYTDGVTDARDSHGATFSENGLKALFDVPFPSAFSLICKIEDHVNAHIGDNARFDDITLLALRHKIEPDDEKHQMTKPGVIENLTSLRGFVENVADHMKLRAETVFAFKLASDEAIINVINHGYGKNGDGDIELTFERMGEKAQLTVHDWGRSFDPSQVDEPDLDMNWEDRPIGGLGLHLIKEMADEVTYRSDPDTGNYLTISMNI